MTEQKTKAAGKGAWIVRIVFVLILVSALVMVMRWRAVVAEYNAAAKLYTDGQYQEAYEALDAVQAKPLASFKVRKEARVDMGHCKAEMASDLALGNERTVEAYDKAVQMMKEAIELAGPSEEYNRRLTEYTDYAEKARAAEEQVTKTPPEPTPAPETQAPASVEE